VAVDDLDLLPSDPDRDRGLREAWTPGEASAHRALHDFLTEDVARYDLDRDTPGIAATSRLSPRLRWGELSPNQVWYATGAAREAGNAEGCAAFLGELGWREFAYHTLYRHPRMATENIRAGFDGFPWPPLDGDALTAWKHGRTGIPLVDAGMRELRRTGTMHNRVRMVVASFLTKNLLIDWREGERWFWDALVDADPASNPFNWQWVAGSGVDAAPYFRIFNPELQRTTFDPHGDYVRRWVPEWGADAYPDPVVDLAETRRAALAAYEQVKRR
jgi:deoxyribodipyrimidine photo-lyase